MFPRTFLCALCVIAMRMAWHGMACITRSVKCFLGKTNLHKICETYIIYGYERILISFSYLCHIFANNNVCARIK